MKRGRNNQHVSKFSRKHSSEYFNEPFTKEEYEQFLPHFTMKDALPVLPTMTDLQEQWEEYKSKNVFTEGFIEEFVACIEFCEKWAVAKTSDFGWTQNVTGIEQPLRSCNSKPLVLHGAMEFVVVAHKQMNRMMEYHKNALLQAAETMSAKS